MRTPHLGWIIVAVPLALLGCDAKTHQRGNVAIFEGHELHKYSIHLSEPLPPGTHDLGTLQIEGIGAVRIAVEVNTEGEISDIQSQWPKDVKPEILSTTSHAVYAASAGGAIKPSGKKKCECKSIHAGGNCDGCSTYNWLEVCM